MPYTGSGAESTWSQQEVKKCPSVTHTHTYLQRTSFISTPGASERFWHLFSFGIEKQNLPMNS
jgi:hypothetical protein